MTDVSAVLARIEHQLDAHDEYHRDTLERMVREAKNSGPRLVTITAAVLAAAAAVFSAWAAFHGHTAVVYVRPR